MTKTILIQKKDPVSLQLAMNEALEKYEGSKIVSIFGEGTSAFITYDFVDYEAKEKALEKRYGKVEETPFTDEFEREGIRYLCKECPYFEEGKDKRRKRWPCKFAEYGVTYCNSNACEFFYKELKAGRLKVRRRDDDE